MQVATIGCIMYSGESPTTRPINESPKNSDLTGGEGIV